MPVLERDDSVLIVIDAQSGFSGADDADREAAERSRAVAAWLAGVASVLGIPAVVTEEDAAANGPTDPAIAAALPDGTPVFDKGVYGLTGEPAIVTALDALDRRTAVLVGAETDVCVAHSAIGLQDLGWGVVVVSDATFSPGAMHGLGLDQLRDAGIAVRHAKGVYYDWVRTLATARAFESEHPELASPPGFSL
jgi:nicotinamidase-related amidase